MLWDQISPPRPPARSAREAGCPGKPAPETSWLPDLARALALRLRLRVDKGGGHRPDPAPHHPPRGRPISPALGGAGVGGAAVWTDQIAPRGPARPRVKGRGRAGGVGDGSG